MDYRESLDYLYGLQRFGIKLGLENIQTLLDRLDRPDRSYGILHVAGSNGKGSVCAGLAEILTRAGYRTGLYTSPHLHSFAERIRIGGAEITEADVAALTTEVRAAAAGIPITFFEFTTALALLYFQRREIDYAVLEVGMGGRLDATNAVAPQVTVITPICRDHAEHLGPDLKSIAGEKAGIIKAGVPVVIGPQAPAAEGVLLTQAAEKGASAYLFGRDFSAASGTAGFSFAGLGLALDALRPGLPGRHQHANLSLAVAAAALLRPQETAIPAAALRQGVEGVRWPGRLEWWGTEGAVLLDGAHNEGGAAILADYLGSLGTKGVRWVVGLKGDKRPEDILGPLLPFCTALYCTAPPVESPFPPAALQQMGNRAGRPASRFAVPGEAIDQALADRRPGEIVLVAGSLFLVAAAREHLRRREKVPA